MPHFYFNGQLYADDAANQFTAATWASSAASSSTAAAPQTSTPAVVSTDPSVIGQWGSDVAWPLEAIEAALMPTGKVLAYGIGGASTLWDPVTDLQTSVPAPPYNIFCTGLTHLPNGDLLLTGGHIHNDVGFPYSLIYDPYQNTWTRGPDMDAGRWYPTNTELGNGDVLTSSGSIMINPDTTIDYNQLPQIYQTVLGAWRDLTGAVRYLPLYPFMYNTDDGSVFNAGPNQDTFSLNTDGTGQWSPVANSNFGFRERGTSVMYDDNKVFIAGGTGLTTTNSTETIDLSSPTPTWVPAAPMTYARRQLNSTLLANGQVLITGGTSSSVTYSDPDGAVYSAELWDPETNTMTTMASMQIPRMYHSTALLLPDGSVLSAGGENYPVTGGVIRNSDAEIYYPPYLFKGPRPTITSAPSELGYGESFFVQTPDAANITDVHLIKLSAVTHAFNEDQRILHPEFTQTAGGLTVTLPDNPNEMPPRALHAFYFEQQRCPICCADCACRSQAAHLWRACEQFGRHCPQSDQPG